MPDIKKYLKWWESLGAEGFIPWAGVPDDDWPKNKYQYPTVQRSITSMVIEDVLDREKQGYETYGGPLTADKESLREWLWDAYEEMLDAAQYLRAAIEALDNVPTE